MARENAFSAWEVGSGFRWGGEQIKSLGNSYCWVLLVASILIDKLIIIIWSKGWSRQPGLEMQDLTFTCCFYRAHFSLSLSIYIYIERERETHTHTHNFQDCESVEICSQYRPLRLSLWCTVFGKIERHGPDGGGAFGCVIEVIAWQHFLRAPSDPTSHEKKKKIPWMWLYRCLPIIP